MNTSTNPWQVTEVKIKPLAPQGASGYKNEIYLAVQGVSQQNNTITGQWIGKTYTVIVSSDTVCEINHMHSNNCINQIQSGMCLEVKVQGNPATSATLNAMKIEQENSKKCEMSSGMNPRTSGYIKLKGTVTEKGSNAFKISTHNNPIVVTNNTHCEYQEHVYMRGTECLANLQIGWLVEVKVNSNYEAMKIEREH